MLHSQSALTPKTAAAILFAGLSVFVFLAFTAAVGVFDEAERDFMLSLRADGFGEAPAGPAWLIHAASEVTTLAGWPLLTLFSVSLVAYFFIRRQWDFAGVIVAVVLGESLITGQLKALFARERPDFIFHLVEASSKSFPSGHSASAAAVYLTLGLMLANINRDHATRVFSIALAILIATLIGASRVYLGVHYPTDVIAGLAIGSAWASAVWLAAWKLTARSGAVR